MIDPYGSVPLQEAADELGVPKAQIARWCADGTLAPTWDDQDNEVRYYTGYAGAPSSLGLTLEGLQKLRDGMPKAR